MTLKSWQCFNVLNIAPEKWVTSSVKIKLPLVIEWDFSTLGVP